MSTLDALAPLTHLLLPVSCAGCGQWETALCPRCAALLSQPARPVEHLQAVEGLPVLAVARYAGPVRPIVLGWKNGAREDLDAAVAEAARRAGEQWAAQALPLHLVPGPLLVVPAPSGAARRLRGRLVAARLADEVARGIAAGLAEPARTEPARAEPAPAEPARAEPITVLSADVLRRGRHPGGAHQAGRSARARRSNRAAAPRVLAEVENLSVLLVDDVVTTGATLGACARALRSAGAQVLGALVLAAAPPPSTARPECPRVPGGPVGPPRAEGPPRALEQSDGPADPDLSPERTGGQKGRGRRRHPPEWCKLCRTSHEVLTGTLASETTPVGVGR